MRLLATQDRHHRLVSNLPSFNIRSLGERKHMTVSFFYAAHSIVNPNATRDPWESGWRQRVADVVNKTLLHKTASPSLSGSLPTLVLPGLTFAGLGTR